MTASLSTGSVIIATMACGYGARARRSRRNGADQGSGRDALPVDAGRGAGFAIRLGAGWSAVPPRVRDRTPAGASGPSMTRAPSQRSVRCLICCSTSPATRQRPTSGRAAEADYGEAVALARELGQTTEMAVSLAGLAWLEARLGREAPCREHVKEALALCAAQDINIGRAWAEFAIGELELGLGRVEQASEAFSALVVLAQRARVPRCRPVAWSGARRGAGPERVGQLKLLSLPRCTAPEPMQRPSPGRWHARERVRGLLGADGELDGHFGAALALHGRTLDVFEEARTRLTYGSRLRRTRRRVDARTQLRAALRTFVQLGARSWAEVAQAELEATGETVARSRGHRPPDAAGAADRAAARPRQDDARGGLGFVLEPEDRRVPPPSHLHQAGHPLARRAGGAPGPRTSHRHPLTPVDRRANVRSSGRKCPVERASLHRRERPLIARARHWHRREGVMCHCGVPGAPAGPGILASRPRICGLSTGQTG